MHRIQLLLNRRVTIASLLDVAARSEPDAAVLMLDRPLPYDVLAERALSLRQVLSFVNRVANVLLDAGLQRYDRVGICKSNAPDYVLLSLAIVRAGGIAVPIHSRMSAENLEMYLSRCGVRLVITDRETLEEKARGGVSLSRARTWLVDSVVPDFRGSMVDLSSALAEASDELVPVHLEPTSEVLIAHTSGTTGFPKGVAITSESWLNGIRAQFAMLPPLPGEQRLAAKTRMAIAPPYNHFIAHVGLCSALWSQVRLWTVSDFEPRATLELIARERIHVFAAFPDRYLQMYEDGLDRHDLSSVALWISAADASHYHHMREFCRRGSLLRVAGRSLLPALFLDTLGSSEIGSAAAYRFVLPTRERDYRRLIGRRIPWLGVDFKVIDEHGAECRPNQIGRLAIRGRTMFRGYWNVPADVPGIDAHGWWPTGDVGYIDRAGRFYHLDRTSDVVRSNRGDVHTLPIEEALLSHPDVGEVCVFGVPHPKYGEAPVALLWPRSGRKPDPEECRGWLNAELDLVLDLQRVVVVEPSSLPRGLTGKVLKRVVREKYVKLFVQPERASASTAGNGLRPTALSH